MELLKSATTTAPGKIILCGEHAVVYGAEAIACGLDLKTKCCVNVLEKNLQLKLSFTELNIEESWEMEDVNCLHDSGGILLYEKLEELVDHYKDELQKLAVQVVLNLYLIIAADNFKTRKTGLHIKVTSDLPIGSGLGSSASLSVSVVSSLLVICGFISKEQKNWTEDDLKEINNYAYEGEKIVHGQPSGIDNTVSTFGHFLSFKAGKIQCLPELNTLKLNMLVVNTKVTRSTKTMVAGVKDRKEKFPNIYASVFQSIGYITEYFKRSLLEISANLIEDQSTYNDIECLVDVNQSLLDSIGVGHPDITKIVNVCRSHSLHSKLTGAGGGGCVFVLLPPYLSEEKLQFVAEELKNLNYDCFRTYLGSSGVHLVDVS